MPIEHGIFTVTDDTGPRPVSVLNTSVIGIVGTAPQADAAEFPLNKPVLIAGSRRKAAKLDTTADQTGGGTLRTAINAILDQGGALIVVVRVAEDADPNTTQTNVIGTTDANGNRSGMQALLDARTDLKMQPRILIAPGFTDVLNVGVALDTIATRLNAQAFIDCPNTSPTAALTYAGNFDSGNLEAGYPALINVYNDTVPWSAWRAGIEAAKDNSGAPNDGYSGSGSNRVIKGVVGLSMPVDFQNGDLTCTQAVLNNGKVSTVIFDDGYRTFGNRSLSSDPRWAFVAHAKVNLVLQDSAAAGLKWARDRKITKALVEDLTETMNNFLRAQVRGYHISGGECFIDPDRNPPESIVAGNLYIDVDWTPLGIAEKISLSFKAVDDYAADII